MEEFHKEVARRLPLAESCLRLLDFVTRDSLLDEVFDQYRGSSYESIISFPLLVHLIADALLEHDGSGHQSFQRAKEDGSLSASVRAMYGKLGRVPLSLSQGLLAQTTQSLQQVFPELPTSTLPASLRDFTLIALDGKKIKHVTKRLLPLRNTKGQVLGGKLVVALEMGSGLVVGMNAHPDGEVSDAPLVPGVLQQVRAKIAGPRLYTSDRQYCDLNQPHLQSEQGDHWLIRYNAKVGFHSDPDKPPQTSLDEQGRTVVEEWGWLGAATDSRRVYCRRITLHRPGEEPVIVVTSLLEQERYPALDLLQVYLGRWGIERVFQRVTEVFELKSLIGSTPQATVFQAAFCFLLYNLIVVLRAYLSVARQREPEEISCENLFEDVKRQLIAWQEVIGPESTLEVLGPPLSVECIRAGLAELLAKVWSDRWLKAPPRKIPKKHPEKEYLPGGHSSVHRLLQKAKETQQKRDSPGG